MAGLAACVFFNMNTAFAQLSGQDLEKNPISTAVPFLTITPDARHAGMGDVGVATDPTPNSTFYNVGQLAFNKPKNGLSISYTPWLGKLINDSYVAYLSGYSKIGEEQAVGYFFRYFEVGRIEFRDVNNNPTGEGNPTEFALGASYSRKMSDRLSLGVTLRYIYSDLGDGLEDVSPGSTASTDIGLYYTKPIFRNGLENKFSWGVAISNIGGKISYVDEGQKNFLPTNLKLGTAYKMQLDHYNSITLALDLNKLLVPTPEVVEENNQTVRRVSDKSALGGMFSSFGDAPFSEELKEITLSAGAEYWYQEYFAARTGFFYENDDKGGRKYVTLGIGARYQRLGLDFAYLYSLKQNHPLGETLRFTLLFNFGQEAETESIVE